MGLSGIRGPPDSGTDRSDLVRHSQFFYTPFEAIEGKNSISRQMFETVGGVDYVQLSDGGRCDVEFFNEHHPQLAVRKFDGFNLEGRSIKVYVDSGRS